MLQAIALAAAANLLGLFLAIQALAVQSGEIVLTAFGIVQLCWLVPLYRRLRRSNSPNSANGVLIVGAFTFLVNALLLTAS